MFYKIKALSEQGVSLILHCFEHKRERQDLLEHYCHQVYYYPRQSVFKSLLSKYPFIVASRNSQDLINRLKADKNPILFEGLHTTFPLLDTTFSDRLVLVRTHNIEHDYYKGLAESEVRFFKKRFFKIEASKLKRYEMILSKADHILAISPFETAYYQKLFKDKTIFIPPFHENRTVIDLSEKGEFAFYHGDLKVSDNYKAVDFLLEVFQYLDYPLVIGGSHFPKSLKKRVKALPHISLIDIAKEGQLTALFAKAQINILPSFQKTGIKLKLINALYQSRFVLGNAAILEDTGLEPLCVKANTKQEMQEEIHRLMKTDYTKAFQLKKQNVLQVFDSKRNAMQIVELL